MVVTLPVTHCLQAYFPRWPQMNPGMHVMYFFYPRLMYNTTRSNILTSVFSFSYNKIVFIY